MHRDALNFCVMTKCVLGAYNSQLTHFYCRTDFLITTSIDGHLKLWKKQETGIEFVKHFRAHASPIVGVSESADGQMFASISDDGSVKVFDVVNFGTCGRLGIRSVVRTLTGIDMMNMLKLDFVPHACCWVHRRGQAQGLLAMWGFGFSWIVILLTPWLQLRSKHWPHQDIRWQR